MEFSELIKKRCSVRDFDLNKKIDKLMIEKLIAEAILAPSEGNLQPWFFAIILSQSIKLKLYQASFKQEAIKNAPALIVTCINKEKTFYQYGSRGVNLYAIQSTALATYQLWLAAVDKGLAGCWIGAFDEDKVKEILDLDENLRPVVILSLGYPKFEPKNTERLELNKVIKCFEE